MAEILVLEDEWLIAADYASILRGAGHRVIGPCATVDAALSALHGHRIDAALLDIQLRGEQSIPVAEVLRDRNIPFAFVSGHGKVGLHLRLCGRKVLPKPVSGKDLLAAIEVMCVRA